MQKHQIMTIFRRWRDTWDTNWKNLLKQDALSLKVQWILMAAVVIACLAVRISTIGVPAIDRTHWKEIDYIEVSTNYYEQGYAFLEPELSWPAEGPSVIAMELPIVPFLASLTYPFLGMTAFSIRFVPMISYLVLVVYIYHLVSRFFGPVVAICTALVSAVMPLYHPFGRVLFSEPTLIAASVVAIFHFDRWMVEGRNRDGLFSGLALSLVLALKPTNAYVVIPLIYSFAFRREDENVKIWTLAAWGFLILIIPASWYLYAYRLEQIGIPEFSIFSGHNRFQTLTLLRTADWYRTMYYRIGGDILGGKVGILLALLGGVTALRLRRGGLFFAYLLAVGLFFIVLAEGQIDAPYRQLTGIPPLSIFVALGAIGISSAIWSFGEVMGLSIIDGSKTTIAILILAFIVFIPVPIRRRAPIFGLDQYSADVPIHQERWNAAQIIKSFAEEDDEMVVMGEYSVHYGGNDIGPVLFYYSGLRGWNIQPDDWQLETIQLLASKGATLFVALPTYGSPTHPPSWQGEPAEKFLDLLEDHYPSLYKSDRLIILNLSSQPR